MTAPEQGGAPLAQPPAGGQGDAGDPAGQYAGYLKGVPEQFHAGLLDGFKKTDQYWQTKLNEAQSRFKPFESLAQQYEPAYIQAAVAMVNELQSDPASVVPWLANELGVNLAPSAPAPPQQPAGQQGDQGSGSAEQWSQSIPPEFLARFEQVAQLAELAGRAVLDQQQATQTEQEMQAFDALLADLGKKYGKFDEDYVLGKIEAGAEPEAAVKAYHDLAQQLAARTAQQRTPQVFGSGGGLPSQQVDVTKLDPRQARSLMEDMIRAAQQQ